MTLLTQRAHWKEGCLCASNGPQVFTFLMVKDPVPAVATYMGVYGDADWQAHTWDLDFKPWRQTPRSDNRLIFQRTPITDEMAEHILESIRKSPPLPAPLDPAVFRRPEPPEPAPYPEPLVTSEDGQEPAKRPGPVTDLAALAESLGWDVRRITYAEGWVPHATHGTPGKAPKQSWAIRMARGEHRAVAVRMGDAWDSFYVLGPDRMDRYTRLGDFQAAIQ